jgi:hypothetical protein
MDKDSEFKNYVKTFQQIYKSLSNIHKVEKILRKKGIDLVEKQFQLKEAVNIQFSDLYEDITK